MAVRTISTELELTGEKTFNDQMKAVNSNLKTLKSDMAAVSAEFKGNENSVAALTAKNKVLQEQYAQQKEKVRLYQRPVALMQVAPRRIARGSSSIMLKPISRSFQMRLRKTIRHLPS